MKIEAVDLFCGAGGLSYGLMKAGITVSAGIDFEESCKYPFEQNIDNAKFIHYDISKIPESLIIQQYNSGTIKLLAGCAPCQPFSSLSFSLTKDRKKSDKWPLLNHFSRLVSEVKPDLVTMENVPQLSKEDIFKEFLDTLESEGYHVFYTIVNAEKYGLPQRRRRLVLLASKLGDIRILTPEELNMSQKTVKDAIYNLPRINAGEKYTNDILHYARKLSDINLKRIKASKPGGTWKDWPESLRLECHKKESGSTYTSVYGRMEWNKPSSTITTQFTHFGTGRYGHPEQHRSITLREAAILQSFPKNYKFIEKEEDFSFKKLGLMIGNAVPVDLGYAIGKSFEYHINNLKKLGDLLSE